MRDICSLVMYREDGEYWLSIYWTEDHVAINDFNYDYLSVIKREVAKILEEFHIMSSREIVEFNQCDDWEKKIDDYLNMFEICLGILVRLFALSNIYFSLFAGRISPMNVVERKARHAIKKVERDKMWSNDP